MTSRPAFIFEKLQADSLATLRYAQTTDLSILARGDLTWTRAELDQAKRMQRHCGQVAPWSEWREAAARVQAELDTRPLAVRPKKPG